MRMFWTTAALLSLLMTAACGDRGEKPTGNDETRSAPTATEPAETAAPAETRTEEPSAPEDTPRERARATAGTAARARSRAAEPGGVARQPESTSRTSTPSATRSERNAAPAAPAHEWREVTLPAGTALPLELESALSSETAQVETPVRARLKQALRVDDITVVPAGAIFIGEVTEVSRAGKVKGRSRLSFTFNQVQAEGLREAVRTNPLIFEGEGSKGEDATKIGAGAVGGAIIGGILGGGEGAAKGAVIGGAAGTGVVLATRGREVKLASGTDLAASLAAPLTIRIRLR